MNCAPNLLAEEYGRGDQFFFSATDQSEDSRIVQGIKRKHWMGRILARFVGLRIKFVRGHTAQAQVETGRLPATKMWLDKV